MPSLLSRLRKGTTSLVPSNSEVPASHPTPLPDVLPFIPSPLLLSPLDRNILSEPFQEPEEQPEEASVGLRPSTRKTPSCPQRSSTHSTPEASESEAQSPGIISISPNSTFGEVGETGTRFLNRLSEIATSGGWSIFGRQNDYTSPRIRDFGDEDSSRDASPNANSLTRSRTTSIHSPDVTGPSSPPNASRSLSTPSQKSPVLKDSESPSSAVSSSSSELKSPKTPERHRSSHSHSKSFFATSSSRDLGFDSPRTFGYPTPPEMHTTGINCEVTPPPPMPPLNHPELANVHSSRFPKPEIAAHDGASPKSSPTSSSTRNLSTNERDKSTYRHRRATIGTWTQGGLFPSLPFSTLGKYSRNQSNHPKAQQMFTSMRNLGDNSPTHTSTPRTRSGLSTESSKNKHQRRWSAEWSARQATEEFGWPALVSKEILRLSLQDRQIPDTATWGEDKRSDPDSRNGVPTRAENVLDEPSILPHQPESHSSGSPASLSHHYSSLGHPISFSGTYDVDINISGPRAVQSLGRFTSSGEVKAGVMPVKGGRHEATTSSAGKVNAVDPSGADPPLASPSDQSPSPALLQIPPSLSFTSPTPETSPFRPSSVSPSDSKYSSVLQIPTSMKTPTRAQSDRSRGKRKVEDVEITPPDHKKDAQRATFAPVDSRPLRLSESVRAPSSYQNKRARISSPLPTPSHSRPGSTSQPFHTYGSWSSRASSRGSTQPHPHRAPSQSASTRSITQNYQQQQQHPQQIHRASSERRTSISGRSIPISALVSPHAPSISRSSKFHMQDPRKPPRKQDTGWALRFKEGDDAGSPAQAWLFYLGFILFPVWWAASFMRTPKTRHVGGSDTEKAVTLDDPQVEHDAKSWRFRCRIMAIISLFTYIPFIALLAIYLPR